MWVWLLAAAVMAGLAFASAWWVCRRERQWSRSLTALNELLPRIEAGDAPVEQLSELQGRLKPLVPTIQNLLHELRSQRTAVAELEADTRHKLANRTDALERTIGTLRQQATRDSLTGLFNRRFLDQFLPTCVQRHLADRKDLCLLMIDVDHFKVLNDTLGHAAGDELLKSIGQLIRSSIRGQDVGFRLGGDEFVIILPDSSVEAGESLVDRLTSMVDALARTLRVPRRPKLAVGLTTLRACGPRATPPTVLESADRALYEVKKARNSARRGLNDDGDGVQSPPLSRHAG
jgi:diguanylate cyclase (GGDEF)-like protein